VDSVFFKFGRNKLMLSLKKDQTRIITTSYRFTSSKIKYELLKGSACGY